MMTSITFGYAIYGHEIVVGTDHSLSRYREGTWVVLYTDTNQFFHALAPFVAAGVPVRFLPEAKILLPSWEIYCTHSLPS